MMKDELIKGLQQQPTKEEKEALKEALTNSNEEDVINGVDFLDLKDAIASVAEEEGMSVEEVQKLFLKAYGDALERSKQGKKKVNKAKKKAKRKQANKSKRKNR